MITIDLRNHGQSPHAATMTYPEMAHDIIDLLDKLDLQAAGLVGHSMGGKVAMSCALNHPERVTTLCVVDIAPVSYQRDFDVILSALNSIPLDKIRRRSDADLYLQDIITEPLLRQFLLQNLIAEKDSFRWRINLDAVQDQMTKIAGFPDSGTNNKSFGKPALFMRGELSDYVLPEHQPLIKELFPVADILTLPDCGHWLHAEKPDLFYASLMDFLDENAN